MVVVSAELWCVQTIIDNISRQPIAHDSRKYTTNTGFDQPLNANTCDILNTQYETHQIDLQITAVDTGSTINTLESVFICNTDNSQLISVYLHSGKVGSSIHNEFQFLNKTIDAITHQT